MVWRLSLIIADGYYGDASRLQEILTDLEHVRFNEGVRRTYQDISQ
jgi:hypothetical protein